MCSYFLAWRIKRALPIIACTRSFLIRYLFHHPSGNILFALIDSAISKGYNAPKLGITHYSVAHYSSSLGHMTSALYLLW